MEEMKPVMKNEKKYKLGIGKKIVAALLAIGLAIGLGVGLVACNKDPVDQDKNPGIEQPADPDDGKEDPDDGKEDPENPGGDIEEPTDPDDGKEDPENPGGDIEEPTDPDDGKEDPPIEDEKEPSTISDLLIGDEVYQQEAMNALMEASLSNILYSATLNAAGNEPSTDITKVEDLEVDISGNEGDTISEFNVYFTFNMNEKVNYYFIVNVEPTEGVSLSDLFAVNDDTSGEVLSSIKSKFKLGRGGANFTRKYAFEYNPSIQESSAALTEALKNVAINDKDLEIEVDENTEYYIVDRGTQLDNILGEARSVELFIKTDNGYQKITYMLGEPTFDIETLLQEINQGSYRKVLTEKGAFTGNQISVSDKETVASTASETYRLYGKMKAKDGSSVHIYLPEDLMNELE